MPDMPETTEYKYSKYKSTGCGSDLWSRVNLAFIVIAAMLLLVSCATVKQQLHEPEFVSQNQPIRDVQVLIASDGSHTRGQIDSLIADVSRSLEQQVGIRLKVTGYLDMKWTKKEPLDMLQALCDKTRGLKAEMAIGFSSQDPLQAVKANLVGGWQAVIDDTFRRYIVTTSLDAHNLTHEICHAFIFSHNHSSSGLMQGVTFYLLPGVPILRSDYLSPEDRLEVLRNKWRDFGEAPAIASHDQEHTIHTATAVTAAGKP